MHKKKKKKKHFLISLEIVANLFSRTKKLSIVIQNHEHMIYLVRFYVLKKYIINVFEEKRKNSDKEFNKYFTDV